MPSKEKEHIKLLQGALDLLVLRTLATMGSQHAYQIAPQISDPEFRRQAGWFWLCLGLAGSPGHVPVLGRSFLFEVSPFDPAVRILSAFAKLLLALLASAIPARHASNTDPVLALRGEERLPGQIRATLTGYRSGLHAQVERIDPAGAAMTVSSM